MADRFAVDSQAIPYGSVGGAGARAMQTEVMRRLQMEEAARAEAERLAQIDLQNRRQAALDAQNAKISDAQLANTQEATASLVDSRKLAGQKLEAELIQKQLEAGQPIPDELKGAFKTNPFLGGLKIVKPTKVAPTELAANVAAPAAPMGPNDVGPETPPAAPEGSLTLPSLPAPGAATSTDVYKGTAEQQDAASKRQFVDDFVSGKMDDQFADADPHQLAAAKLIVKTSGGAGLATALASLMKPTKPADESVADRTVQIEKDFYDAAKAAGKSDADARIEARRKVNTLQGEQARTRQDITVNAGRERQQSTFANQAEQAFAARVSKQNTDLQKSLERADRAEELLNHPNFVNDTLSAPEVLQVTAGGMGSGLRMTDTELNRIFSAQTKMQELAGRFRKATGLGEQTVISDEMRKNLQAAVAVVRQAQARKVEEDAQILDELDRLHQNGAVTTGDIRRLEAKWFRETANSTKKDTTAAPATPAPSSNVKSSRIE